MDEDKEPEIQTAVLVATHTEKSPKDESTLGKMTTEKLEKQSKEFDGSEAPLRPEILRLMGYPASRDDDEYDQETITPNWDEILELLISNPAVASYLEGEDHPLDDALWIENDPVPLDVAIRLLRAFPKALSSRTFAIADGNPNTRPEVLRVLRASDVDSHFTVKRTELVQLMGFPPCKYDDDYCESEIEPDWEAVRKRLVTHPEEAIVHDECYPLEDAVSIEWDAVPLDVVDTLVRLAPEGLTDGVFANASANEELDCDILRFLFKADRKIQKKTEDSFVKL
jgi:hypothetical protein